MTSKYNQGKVFYLSESDVWDEALGFLPKEKQDIWFSSKYYRLFEPWQGGRAACFIYNDFNNIALYPFIINTLSSAGYSIDNTYIDIQGAYGYNGIVSSTNDDEFLDQFYECFNHWCSKNKVIAEFTRFHPLINNHLISNQYLQVVKDRNTVLLRLQNGKRLEQIRHNYRRNAIRNIKRAQNAGITWKIATQTSEFALFGEMYRSSMKRIGANKFYYFDNRFFIDLATFLSNNVILLMFYHNSEIVGGFVLLTYNLYAHNFLLAVTDKGHELGISEFMQDVAIEISTNNGCEILHLGGGATSSDSDSLLRFKEGFSKEKATFYIGKKIHNHQIYNDIMQLWKKKNKLPANTVPQKLLAYRD